MITLEPRGLESAGLSTLSYWTGEADRRLGEARLYNRATLAKNISAAGELLVNASLVHRRYRSIDARAGIIVPCRERRVEGRASGAKITMMQRSARGVDMTFEFVSKQPDASLLVLRRGWRHIDT